MNSMKQLECVEEEKSDLKENYDKLYHSNQRIQLNDERFSEGHTNLNYSF